MVCPHNGTAVPTKDVGSQHFHPRDMTASNFAFDVALTDTKLLGFRVENSGPHP